MASGRQGERPLILLIDDDPDCRQDLGEALSACGLRPLTAESGQRGLELLKQCDIAAVITDWQMPGMDGLAVAEAVRGAGCGAPVVLITGAADWRRVAQAARARGVRRCFRKPLDLRALLDCLRGIIGDDWGDGRATAGARPE